jgi:hypothetical protein
VRRPVRRRHALSPMTALVVCVAIIMVVLSVYNYSTARGRARDVLVQKGYSEIQMTGWKPMNLYCDSRSGIPQGFAAKRNGVTKTGYVCTSPVFSYVVDG